MAGRDECVVRVEESDDGIVVVSLSGSVDQSAQADMRRKIIPYCERQDIKLLIDFRDTLYMNSSSIGALGDFQRRCLQAGGEMVGCCVDRSIMKILEVLGMTSVVKFFEKPEAARAYLLKA